MERVRRRMIRDFERTFNRYDPSYDFEDFGLSTLSRDPFFRPLRYEPEILSLRAPSPFALRNPESLPIDENTKYYAKYEVNDNGHVWKKTIEKEPGQEWKTHVEEYDVGKAIKGKEDTKQLKGSEGQKEAQSIENKEKQEQSESPEKGIKGGSTSKISSGSKKSLND